MSMMLDQSSTMGPPGPAAAARAQLADYYDRETASMLELARNAHEMGAKSSFQNLMRLAMKNRKFGEEARRHEKLQGVLGQLAAQQQAPPPMPGSEFFDQEMPPGQIPGAMPWGQPQAPQSVDPSNPASPNLVPESLPSYERGGAHPGGSALVGEAGPEVVDLPAGSTVHPNPATTGGGVSPGLIMVIRTLLDALEEAQGGQEMPGMGLPAQDGQGMPSYAYGTPNTRPGGVGGNIGSAWNQLGGRAPSTPDQYGGYAQASGSQPGAVGARDFHDMRDGQYQFSGPGALQKLQIRNAEAGNYDPLGSDAAANISRQTILQGMGGRQGQAAKLADLYAQGDPSFRAYARLKAGADTQSEAARAYEQTRARQVGEAQDFGRNVYMGQLGAVTRKDPREPGAFESLGGQALGAVTGGFLGGGRQQQQQAPTSSRYVPPDQYGW